MNRLQRWLDRVQRPEPTATICYFNHGLAKVMVDPTSTAPAASFNRNSIHLWGGQGLPAAELESLAREFYAQGVERFFVWLSPGPSSEVVRAWLAAKGAAQVPWTRYPTMLHTGNVQPQPKTTLAIRKVTRDDLNAGAFVPVEDAIKGHYLETAGSPGFHHFAAFDGGRAVATAILAHFEEVGYLMEARTAEPFRRRGAQSALIAARVEEARRLGCTLILSQTLTMLKESYGNLTRAGFETVYNKEVYACLRSSAQAGQLP